MKLSRYACCLCFTFLFLYSKAQLYKIDIEKKIDKSSAIVEGKVVEQHAFWNPQHTIIYTANTIHVYKLFKGNNIADQIEILTQGGSVGNSCLVVSEVLQLQKGETGMFFCTENALQLHSPFTKKILYDVYSSQQGFLKYDLKNKEAYAPFANYKSIEQNLYAIVKNRTGITQKTVDASFDFNNGAITEGITGIATISSFLPDTVHGGAINDPANNILTINGSGFGNSPSGSAGINFKDGNNSHTDPDFNIAYSSPYIISWTDTKITLNVPDRAATGKFSVVLNDGTTVLSSKELQVFFSVLDAEFVIDNKDFVSEARLMNTNGSGGYTYQYSTSTSGGAIDVSTSPVKAAFVRAVNTWKEIEGANFTEGSTTTLQAVKDDRINLIEFDNNNTGVPKMADGVLEATYSWFSACSSSTDGLLTAQKTGFDIIIRNKNVSEGSVLSLVNGPCFPGVDDYDIETIILHELGHALNLAHINDDYQQSSNSYLTVNPSKLMHYGIINSEDRRSPDASAYQGVLYTSTPQGGTYGNCNLFTQEMQRLTPVLASNDECPSSFPATEIQNNTKVFFDLIHATSNKLKDPAFTQVNCNNAGTYVTNNAYYAFMTGNETNLSLNVSNYTLVPSGLSSCNGSGVRLALYDVSSCPEGQNFPNPVSCATFNSNGTIKINTVQSAHKYLLYFDGLRNTKASFSVTFNGDSNASVNNTSVVISPNPVNNGSTTIEISNTAGSFYEYALFDITGRLLKHDKISVVQSTQTFTLYLNNLPAGVYVLRLADENGKLVTKGKILKL